MRPHSRYRVDPTNPRAKAVCDRCGKVWQLSDLIWQFEWIGPRLQNLRFYVCPECLDKPQPNRKTIVIPADPIPVFNPRPEAYVQDDNPLSAIGVSANFALPAYGSRIGTMTVGGGINAAFDGNTLKPTFLSAATPSSVINSSFGAYVGINWQGNVSNLSMPSSLKPPIITHSLSSVTIVAPRDRGFMDGHATTFVVQYSPVDTTLFSAWTTLATGSIVGTPSETIGVTIPSSLGTPAQFHRVAFLGDGTTFIAAAQVSFSVNDGFLE